MVFQRIRQVPRYQPRNSKLKFIHIEETGGLRSGLQHEIIGMRPVPARCAIGWKNLWNNRPIADRRTEQKDIPSLCGQSVGQCQRLQCKGTAPGSGTSAILLICDETTSSLDGDHSPADKSRSWSFWKTHPEDTLWLILLSVTHHNLTLMELLQCFGSVWRKRLVESDTATGRMQPDDIINPVKY